MCVERAFQTTLSRLPFVHSSALEDPELPRELHLAIAAVGARDLDGNRGFGTDFFYEAEQLLQQANRSVSNCLLQASQENQELIVSDTTSASTMPGSSHRLCNLVWQRNSTPMGDQGAASRSDGHQALTPRAAIFVTKWMVKMASR